MNDPRVYITTSWDDGHPCDLRLAEMLQKHGLCGTFYVPRRFYDQPCVAPREYEPFGPGVEVGAHTIHHVVLTRGIDGRAEIEASKDWVEQQTGRPCRMFCPPSGRFTARHRAICEDAGFLGMRTVEGWSLDLPRRHGRLCEMPTTVQAHPTPAVRHLRNLAKRRAVRGTTHWLRRGCAVSWGQGLRRMTDVALRRGGVIHLWGHSWEIDAADQWAALDDAFAFLGQACADGRAQPITNGALAELFCGDAIPLKAVSILEDLKPCADPDPATTPTPAPALAISTPVSEDLNPTSAHLGQVRRSPRSLSASRGRREPDRRSRFGLRRAVRRFARAARFF